MRHRLKPLHQIGSILCALILAAGPAGAIDLSDFWNSRCKECHGDAAAFARSRLKAEGGVLASRHSKRDVLRFLGQHEMGPTHAEGIYAMLLAQVASQPVFEERCAGCHKTATEFARTSLVIKDGKLIGRSNGREVSSFLVRHGGLRPDEIPGVMESLTRASGEIVPATKN